MPRFRVCIVGGGIGGLTLAGLLSADDHEVTVLERAPAWAPVGAGIVLAPNAMRVAQALGIDDGTTYGVDVIMNTTGDAKLEQCIEAKAGRRFVSSWCKGLRAMAPPEGLRRRLIVYAGDVALCTEDGIDVLPFADFAGTLTDGDLLRHV